MARDAGVAVNGVSKTFGPVRAVVGVTASFAAARVAVIEGSNGAGKSTLLAMIGTLVRPTSGSIDYGALGPGRARVRGALGWLGNESLCYPDLTGRQNIELAARLHGVDPADAFERACSRFGLGPFADRAVRTYSRGQRQRVALSRALVHRPRLLLLDEPTVGLDPKSVNDLRAIVRQEADGGAIVVVVTHDGTFADAVGDDRLTMERGRLKPSAPSA